MPDQSPSPILNAHTHEFEHYAHDYHHRLDPHQAASRLSDIILGGQDGLVNVLGVILGVAAATNDPRIVIVAGLAATFAESVSMGAVAYTSTRADSDLYESERAREHRHIHLVPALERQEIRDIYQRKGFEGELLDQIVDKITADKDVWVTVMMAEELQLVPTDRRHAIRSSLVVGLAAIVGSLIPLAPFIFLPVRVSMAVSVAIAALTLFAVGVYKARVTVGHPGKSGLEMAVIGTLSALVGYGVGVLFKIPATP
ncbi:MAG: VIT1/CCC1 transporter family protein [Chloroflexi bacterium]|nr:VIT1/CCC1 transporter family protein [Chloroflexota bacterium]MBI3760326.1 VIT1/CCC1 transporter family protein [Chloroflexota bacterium]